MGDMSNKMVLGDEARSKIIKGIDKLANIVKVTFGPFGKTVIIADPFGKPYLTKDGVSVSNYVKLDDLIEDTGATLVKEVAQATAIEAGDGTTTSIILVQSLMTIGDILLRDGVHYSDIKESLDRLLPLIIKELKASSKKLNKSNIKTVARIAANNDVKISNTLDDAFKLSENIEIQAGTKEEDEVIFIEGLKYASTYFSKIFITDKPNQIATLKKPVVLLVDGHLNRLDQLELVLTYCNKKENPLLIVTDDISDGALKLLETNHINNALKILVIKSPGFGQHRKELLTDLAAVTGAKLVKVLNKPITINQLGAIESVSTNFKDTLILVNNKGRLDSHKALLEEQLKNPKLEEVQVVSINKRLDHLSTDAILLKVGGASEVEMKERKDRIEDAVRAVQSALAEGIIAGGGTTLINIYNKLTEKTDNTIDKEFLYALTTPYTHIVESTKDDINFDDIFDPVKVTRCAVENAFSVAKTLLGTEAIISKAAKIWN